MSWHVRVWIEWAEKEAVSPLVKRRVEDICV
jgi:hypothetical protein